MEVTAMKTTTRLSALLAALILGSTGARAVDSGPYTMEILIGGVPVREYAPGGTTYVEARRGSNYAVRLSNRTGERVAVALAVDGLNSIDARRTSAPAGRKWILGPWESVTIEGWQTSVETARRFVFTSERDSYGAWLGRTADLGIVSAAFFRERRPAWSERRRSARLQGSPSAGGAAEKQALSEDSAATGIGDEIGHSVRTVDFDAESSPATMLRIRYEYRSALVRLGVLPRSGSGDDTLSRRERARGFEDEGFAPDPYRRFR
jgi:hypothetical protein